MQPIPNEPGFFRALKTGATSTAQSLFPAAKLMASPGDEAAAEQLRQVGQTAQDAYRRTEFGDIGERAKAGDVGGALGATWDKFKELAGESIGFQAPAAAAGLAARVGVGAAAAAAGVAAAPAAAIGVGAYGLTLLGQYVASNLGRQVEENKGKPVERLPATIAGSGQAALDLLGAKFLGLGKLLGLEGKEVAEQTVEQLVKAAQRPTRGQLAKTAAVGGAKGIGFEVPQEVAQSVLERWQAGLPTNPFDDPGAAKEYAEAAAGALMLGGPLGAVGRIGEQRRERGEAATELKRRGEEEDAERQRILAGAENAPSSEVFTGIPPEAPSGKPLKQTSLFDKLPKGGDSTLEGMTPSGAAVEQPRSILGAELSEDKTTAELMMQRDELLRVRGLLDRETARATTTGQKVALQYQIKEIDTQLQDVQEGLKKLGGKGPSKKEAARFQQGELGPSTYFRDYPDVPEEPVPAAVEMENLRLTKDNLPGLFKQKSRGVVKGTKLYKQLLGLDLTTTEGRSEFNRLMADADKRKVSSLDYGAVEQLMTEAARYRDATTVVPQKGKLVEPTVIGEQPQPTGTLTPAQQAFFEQTSAAGQQPGLEVQRAQARQQQEGPSPIIAPGTTPQVGGRGLLQYADKPTQKLPAKPTWTPELVTDETLDKFGISNNKTKKPVVELRKVLFGGRDLNNPKDAAAVRDALRKYQSHGLVSADQKSKVDQAIRGLGLAGQQSLDLFPRPEKETARVDRPEAAGESVVAPVSRRADAGREAAGAGAAPVVGDQGRAGQAAGRAEPQQATLNASELADEYIKADTEGRGTDRFDIYKQLRSQSPDNLFAAISDTRAQRQALLSKDGRPPNRGSPKTALWGQLSEKDTLLTSIWGEASKRAPEKPAPAALKPKKTNATTDQQQIGKVKAALRKAGYSTGEINAIIEERSDPVTGLDMTSIGELLELGTKPVGAKLDAKASAAVQAGDLRGALQAISKSGSTPMMRMVAKKLLGYVGQTKIKIGDVSGSGQYDPDTDTITINPNALHEHTVLHEMVHAAISHVLRNRSHPLTQQLSKLYMRLLPRIQNTYGATSLQEFASEAQSNPEFRAMLRNIRAPQNALMTAWDHIVDAVRKLFRFSPRQSQTALDKIDKVIDDLLTTAKVEPRTPGDILFLNANVSGSSAAYQQLLNSMGQQTRMLPEFTQGWFDSLGKLNRTLVGAITKTLDMNHLAEIYGDRVPAIRGIINLLNERRGYENTQFDRAGKNSRMLKRMYDKYNTSPKKEWEAFTDVIFDSTRTLYDPSAPSQSGNPEAEAGPDIQNKWNRLPKDLQDAYRDIKDHYTAMYKDYIAALDKDLIALPDDERANIRAAIENKIKPYFPLMRFGDYWLEFERNGERYVTAFETPEERQRAIATLKLDRKSPGFKTYKKIEEVLSRPPSDPMIQRTLKALTDNGVDKETKDRVHRALLQLNPQQSAIFNMLKREGYEGFSRDLIRAYTTMTPRLISQTASRMYNRSIEETAGYARVQLEEISNATDEGYDALADAVAEELSGKQGSRLDVIMNPKPNKLASTMNWLTYGYFMGANVSTALINMTQTPMVAYPIMSSKFGIGNTTKALMDAYKFYGSHAFKNPLEKFKTHGYLSPLNTLPKGHPLTNLYSELQRRGQINISITQELLDLQAQPTDKVSKTKQRVGVAMSFAHQMTEMSNREITAVAAYNLAKQAKMSEAQAIDYAIDVVTKSHGSGMMDTAGPIFQHPVGRVVLMFKRFAQLMVFRAARTAYVAIKGDASLSPQEQAEAMAMAKKQLLGMYVMAFAFAGAQGLPLYGLVEMLYNIFQSAFGDDMEYEDFTNMVRESLGEMAFKGPVNYATGRDIAQRTGFGDMLIRDDSRSMAELGPFMYYFQQFFGGAFLSAANNLNRGFGMINDGYVYRGLETMSPAVIRNALKGARFWSEGATTIKGDPITDALGVHDALFQMSGFAPTKLTEIYEKRGFMKEYETFIKDKRRGLLDQYEIARDSGDPDTMDTVQDKISRFNTAYPAVKITRDTIKQSLRGREQREREAIYGVQIDKRLREQIKDAVAGGVE
jgi:hypothetical protein